MGVPFLSTLLIRFHELITVAHQSYVHDLDIGNALFIDIGKMNIALWVSQSICGLWRSNKHCGKLSIFLQLEKHIQLLTDIMKGRIYSVDIKQTSPALGGCLKILIEVNRCESWTQKTGRKKSIKNILDIKTDFVLQCEAAWLSSAVSTLSCIWCQE